MIVQLPDGREITPEDPGYLLELRALRGDHLSRIRAIEHERVALENELRQLSGLIAQATDCSRESPAC